MWFVPTWLFTMLSLMASLLAKNSSMGGVLSGILLLLELIMKDFFLNTSSLLLIFVPISMWKPDSHLWWSSRALLFGLGALIVLGIWRWIRREEHLLDAITS
jgi:membrane protein implicated in regulation of membrane protease activity